MSTYHGPNSHTAQESLGLANGMSGFDRIGDTATKTGDYFALLCIDTATFDSGTAVESGDAPAAGDSVNPGVIVYAPFTDVQLQSGTVYAYKR